MIRAPIWEDFLALAFCQIRSYGATSIQVMRRMKAFLSDLINALPEEHRPALRRQQKRLDATIARSFPDLDAQMEASAEDREGLGATRRRPAETTSALLGMDFYAFRLFPNNTFAEFESPISGQGSRARKSRAWKSGPFARRAGSRIFHLRVETGITNMQIGAFPHSG